MDFKLLENITDISQAFIDRFVLCDVPVRKLHNADYKTALQEKVQEKKNQILAYALVGESGPDHRKTFTVHVFINNELMGMGEGSSKKNAEQMAASDALAKLGDGVA